MYTVVDPNDGHSMGFGSSYWTQDSSSHGMSASVIDHDYVNGHAAQLNATEIMIVNGYQSDGSFEAYTIWSFRDPTNRSLIIREQPLRTVLLVRGTRFNTHPGLAHRM